MTVKSTLFFLVVIALTLPPASASPEEDEAKAKALIKQLGSESFKVREQAAKELVELGGAARRALEEGGKSPDAEVAERCRKLLPKAYEHYVQQLLNQHFANPKRPLSEDLPGLKRWLEIAGRSNESKSSYREILLQHQKLLVQLANDPKTIDEQYEQFARELYDRIDPHKGPPRKNVLTQVDLTLFLFLATDPNLTKDWTNPNEVLLPPYHIVRQIDLKNLSDTKISPEPFKKLFVEYLAREKNDLALRQAVDKAGAAELKEALPVILKIAKDKNAHKYLRVFAIRATGQLGGRDTLPELTVFFDDNNVALSIRDFDNKAYDVRIRDAALAMAIHLHGQKLTDFGFKHDLLKLEAVDWVRHFVISDDAREQALTKWKAFAEKEKLPTERKP